MKNIHYSRSHQKINNRKDKVNRQLRKANPEPGPPRVGLFIRKNFRSNMTVVKMHCFFYHCLLIKISFDVDVIK